MDPGRKQKQGRRTSTTKIACKHETTEVNQNETEPSTPTSGKGFALVTAQGLASCSVHPLPGLPWKGCEISSTLRKNSTVGESRSAEAQFGNFDLHNGISAAKCRAKGRRCVPGGGVTRGGMHRLIDILLLQTRSRVQCVIPHACCHFCSDDTTPEGRSTCSRTSVKQAYSSGCRLKAWDEFQEQPFSA
jgi:hypothetical protein